MKARLPARLKSLSAAITSVVAVSALNTQTSNADYSVNGVPDIGTGAVIATDGQSVTATGTADSDISADGRPIQSAHAGASGIVAEQDADDVEGAGGVECCL